MDVFVKQHEPELYWNTYITYPYDIQRADAFRYVLMFHLGGIYIDMDNGWKHSFLEIVTTLESLDSHSLQIAAFAIDKDVGLTNDFLISTPRHPIYRQFISRLNAFNHFYLIPYLTVIVSTGPMYTRIQEHMFCSTHDNVVRLLDYRVYHSTMVWKTRGGSWYSLDAKIIIYIYYNGGIILSIALKYSIPMATVFILFQLSRTTLVLKWTQRYVCLRRFWANMRYSYRHRSS